MPLFFIGPKCTLYLNHLFWEIFWSTETTVYITANWKILGKFNFLSSFHIWVSFLKIYGFNDQNKFLVLAYEQLTCMCIICPAFVVVENISWEKLENEMKFWNCTEFWILSKYLDWHFRLTIFTAVLISASDWN